VSVDADRSVVEQRVLEEAQRLPPGGVVSGWAALRLAGGNFFDGTVDGTTERPVDLVAPAGAHLRATPGIRRHHERLGAAEIVLRHGVPCAIAERALFDEIKWTEDLRAAVAAADMALSAGLVTFASMRAHRVSRAGERGVGGVRRVLDLAEDRVRSPPETDLRLIWVLDAGLPRPLCNWPIADASGRRLGKPDLLCTVTGVAGEYDGRDHLERSARAVDLAREQEFRNTGLELFRVVGSDIRDRRLVVRRMRDAVARAAAGQAPRTWLIRSHPGPL
jgi:hypothetical protein